MAFSFVFNSFGPQAHHTCIIVQKYTVFTVHFCSQPMRACSENNKFAYKTLLVSLSPAPDNT